MTDKINGQGFRPVDTGGTRRPSQPERAAGARPAAGGPADSADQVSVTSSSLLLSRLEDALQSSPAVDAERVRAVRDAIASGAYEIDPGVIAEKIIRLERELSF
jgi:negative regulator of flagellin synthesis FlgM